ncbi:MAG: hypothetical protein M1828_002392 [Chrysothrix sp. TS-e1954]|nr:MAG: hypothetical protein M1828_002392 [Chrysothrix sp. TS-e1954]
MRPSTDLYAALLQLLGILASGQTVDYTDHVNIFRGTGPINGGNMFPGVVAEPYAVVKLGPDLQQSPFKDAYSGYLSSGNITGFSMMHESGTGGAPKYGVVSQMPVAGPVPNPLADLSVPRAVNDTGSVGNYVSQLASNITVELAATSHAALYQYTFPTGEDKNIVVDVSHVLISDDRPQWTQHYVNGSFQTFPDGHYEGYGTYNGGWNVAPDWTIYFCGYFDSPATSSKTFQGNGTNLTSFDSSSSRLGTDRVGGIFSFNDTSVTSRVGVSFISTSKACSFVKDEVPSGSSLESLTARSKSAWNTAVLSKIKTTATNASDLTQLYSNLYAMFLIPSNRTGENPVWTSTEPYYDDIFTFWDLFRCATSLTHVIDPTGYAEQLRSIIDIWRESPEGYLPDARSSNRNGETQGGSNADNILADAYVKGVQDGINWADAYSAMMKDAEVAPPNNDDARAPDSSTLDGRGALPDWLKYGYITPTYSRAVSRGVEYAANDFGLYQVATGLGHATDAEKYLNRSRNWRNYYNKEQSSLNFTGFVVPREANGTFPEYDPLQCGGCYWEDPFYEDTPWEYTFASGHHDMAHLVNISGGAENFTKKLDTIFTPGLQSKNDNLFGGTIVNPANEPSFTSPYLFNFAGRQDLSVKRSRHIARAYYNDGVEGIPGNSDAGAMQAWQLWNMIGLYPLVGQTTFLIHAPWFESMDIDLEGGKTLSITSTGGDVANDVYYVQSLRVNGNDWTKSWVSWDDVFANGGTMDFVLGSEVKDWATGELPPSPASV